MLIDIKNIEIAAKVEPLNPTKFDQKISNRIALIIELKNTSKLQLQVMQI